MHRSFRVKRPRWPEQPVVPFVGGNRVGKRVTGMEIERNIEFGDRPPERSVLREIVVQRTVRGSGLREAIYQRANEAELLHAARQLPRGFLRILHGKSSKTPEAVRLLCNLCGQ